MQSLEEKNAELEKQLAKKNRDLEIEAALERVRTVAMGMRKPGDLLSICKALFAELQLLDFNDLRNAIIHTYLNVNYLIDYDYSDFTQGHISHIPYSDNPIAKKYAKDIQKTRDAFAELIITGSKLKEWKVFMDANNEAPDERLGNATSLYYYIYAVGDASIGISTFSPIEAEKLDVLKRFRNVFDLAYSRFMDITKAEAQAREAQIELSLERVRTVAMSMRVADDLLNVCQVLFEEFKVLGFGDLRNAMINILHDDKGYFLDYDFNDSGASVTPFLYNSHPMMERQVELTRSASDAFIEHALTGDELEDFKAFRERNGEPPDPKLENISGLYYYFYSIGIGSLGISTFSALTDEKLEVLKRFRNVFDLAYRRYSDIQLAAAQARESRIETALERVRAAAMAMKKPEEVLAICDVMYKELISLGITNIRNAQIAIQSQSKQSYLICAYSDTQAIALQETPHSSSPIIREVLGELGRSKDAFYQREFTGKKFKEWLKWRESLSPLTDIREKEAISLCFYLYSFGPGHLGISTYNPISTEQIELLKRFKNVFELCYTRYADVAQAEAQSREAQIELALERVRARTMAMQKSEELKDIIKVVYEQLVNLNIPAEHAGFIMDYRANDDMHIWLADKHFDPSWVSIPYFDSPHWNSFVEAKKKGTDFFANLLTFDEKNKFYEDLFKLVPGVTDEARDYYLRCPGLAISTVLLDNIGLYIENFSGIPYTDEENSTLMRFGKVFQQTYTRFLDLQKAEAQAREVQIELSLERIRAKTMAMHTSEHVGETVATMFDELVKLGIEKTARCGIAIIDDNREMELWRASYDVEGNVDRVVGRVDMTVHPMLEGVYLAWKNNEAVFSWELTGKDQEDYFRALNNMSQYPVQFDLKSLPAKEINSVFFFPEGCVYVFTVEPLSPDSIKLFKRFAGVFSLTYRRFLDLQRAEAQAKESYVQLALERVRARTMAMRRSDELRDIVKVVFERLQELNFAIDGAAFIATPGNTDKEFNIWVGDDYSEYPSCFRTPFYDTPVINDLAGAMKSGLDFFTRAYSFDEKNAWFNYAFQHTDYKNLPRELKSLILAQQYLTQCFALTKNSGVGIHFHNQRSLSELETDILKRFSKVFEQSYIRFLDLQKAEAQAKESHIQLALERVRARTMAMQKSDELAETSVEVFKQLISLGIAPNRLFIGIIKDNSGDIELWATDEDGSKISTKFTGNKNGNRSVKKMYDGWEAQKKSLTIDMKGGELEEYFRYLAEELKVPFKLGRSSKRRVQSIAYFSQGFIGMASPDEQPKETIDLMERFAGVFNLTYTRFNDLQKAETQAREAIKQASVDRVRGEIASMRSTEDLARITPLIWNELTILGIPFIRCGVFIMDEEEQIIHAHLSTSEGSALATFNLKFNSEGIGQNVLPAWRNKQIATQHWSAEEFAAYTNNLVAEGTVKSKEKYVTEHPDTSLDLHFLPFLQGMLYVGSTAPLTDDEIDLVQSLADAFSTAYARYEDFNKLEVAKQQVENTLTDLKAAQTKLIQSEKMASLGELTAGIAHEIQNPLNFVNNFSEVNQEMIDELAEELKAGNIEEALAIAADIKDNEQKINHHGKRADGIVKGMLQHSRTGGGEKTPTNINALADEFLRLSYHGLRAKDKEFNAELVTHFDERLPKVSVIPQDIGRVLLNLFNNAFYAVNQKKKALNGEYKPEVTVTTLTEEGQLVIKVKDNGVGMPEHIKEKIMQPFFTTKPTGEGTGLGLSLTYDMVVKGHGGTIQVNSVEGEGSEFIIQLPIG